MGPSIVACSVMRLLSLPEVQALGTLTRDGRLLIFARVVRLFGFGFLSMVFALYLAALGLTDGQIGLVLTLTLVGMPRSPCGSRRWPTTSGGGACSSSALG
jgi:hypothetical protein